MRNVVELEGLTHTNWLRARQQGIGGSDVAAIVGVSPYAGPFDVYVSKVEPIEETQDSGNAMMRMGRLLEDGIAQAYAETTGSVIEKPTHMVAHDDYDWMLASPDRYTDNTGPGVLEVKYVPFSQAWDRGVPDSAELQTRHYMAVLDRDYADVAALLGGRDLRIYRIDRDAQVEDAIMQLEAAFWQRVVDRDPPHADEYATAALRRLYPKSEARAVELSDDLRPALRSFLAAREQEAEAKKRKEAARNRICAALGDADTGLLDGVPVVTWKSAPRSDLDLDRLTADHPDLVAKYRTDGSVRTFLPKRGINP